MTAKPPEAFTLDRIETPVGTVLLVTDAEGAVRALDFDDYTSRMMRLLARHYGQVKLTPGAAPLPVRKAVIAYFNGDARALETLIVTTAGTPFQREVWAALRAIPAGETRSYGQLAVAIGEPGRHHRALSSGRRCQRDPDRLCRRTGAQALASGPRGQVDLSPVRATRRRFA
jgi:methylated-DNA-[protein]-cysteine S-methyltransferase